MYFYPPSLSPNFCVWKSFQRGSLKIHLVFIEKVSVRDGTIDTPRKIGQDRKGKEHVEAAMRAGTRRDEMAPIQQAKNPQNKETRKKMVSISLFCRCCLDLCSPTSAFKAPAGGDALSSAPWLPQPPRLFIFCRDYTSNSFSICSLF